MKKNTREQKLLDLLKLNEKLDVKQVCDALHISEATARRLFHDLAEQGKLIRIHGGIQLVPQNKLDYSYQQASMRNNEQKINIGQLAAKMIQNNDKLFLDSGTTVMRMAETVASMLERNELHGLIIITNSFTIVEILAKYCKVILTGGEPRLERRDVCGTLAEDYLRRFHIDKAFIGADAIHHQHGFMTTDERTAKMNEIVIDNANLVYVLADTDKFNKKSFISYARFKDVDKIISESNLQGPISKLYKKAGAKF